MTFEQNANNASLQNAPQSDVANCNLQTGRNLEMNQNNNLTQNADCSVQIAANLCNLTANSSSIRLADSFPDCTQTLSPYGRDESLKGTHHPVGREIVLSRSVVLCLDLGTTTGWALQTSTGLITSGTVNFKNDRWQGGGMRFLKFTRFLNELQTNVGQIQLVFFEEVRRHLGVDAAHLYGGFMAHLTAWCEQNNIAYEAVPVGTIKRHITGKGNASKQDVIDAIRLRGHQPSDDNEADALALLFWAMANRMGVAA